MRATKKGALYIRDLGYFDLSIITEVMRKSAYLLTRLQKDVNIYLEEADDAPVNTNEFLKKGTENGNTIDQIVYIGERRVSLRLIAEKVPEEVKNQRAKKYKSARKKEPTEDYITWSGFSVFLTNIPKEMFASGNLIITIYKIRWKIELIFKRLKSIAKIDAITLGSRNSILCVIYSKLIGILMGEIVISYAASICNEDEELSEYKINDWLKQGDLLGNTVKRESWKELFIEMIKTFYLHCKDKRKKNKSLQSVIEDAIQSGLVGVENIELAA